jgi:thiol:disulfide interchange protein
MKKILAFLLLAGIFLNIGAKAQDTIKNIVFATSFEQTADGKTLLKVVATPINSAKIISMDSANALGVSSSLTLDSSVKRLSQWQEAGEATTAALAELDNQPTKHYSQQVTWTTTVEAAANASIKITPAVYVVANGTVEVTDPIALRAKPKSEGSTKQTIEDTAKTTEQQSPWSLLALGLLIGFAAVFTPCVFPLLPMTASFFTKRSKTKAEGIRNGWLYALFIIFIYVLPALLLTAFSGDKTLIYRISTSTIANILFFVVFLIFAISFFGAFELTLPSSWTNAADSKAGKGGIFGIFFMALTMVIVSFSCTGPFVSAMLVTTAQSGISIAPIMGMLGFGLGFAVPFALMATFPSLLNSLPKSGGWLNTVKVSFGFIELALALKFLSNVDQALHWRLLDREIFLALWIVIFVLLGIYLLGKLKFNHDSDTPHVGIPRLFLAIASLSFALYMLPGMWGAPLKGISGILPNPSTQDFNLHESIIELKNKSFAGGAERNNAGIAPKKYTALFKAPYGLTAYFDYDEGMAAAKALGKPVMIDFTGHSCANCRKMEAGVWVNESILNRLQNDFVLIQLYVDDKTELPENEWYTNKEGLKITTIGGKNLDVESSRFNEVSQPFYVYLDQKGELLTKGVGYGDVGTVELFAKHLDAVKAKFKQ